MQKQMNTPGPLAVMATVILALSALLPLGSSVLGQQKDAKAPKTQMPRPTQPMPQTLPQPNAVMLKCEPYYHSDVTTEVNITNNTSKAVPVGTKIFWKTTKGAKGELLVAGSAMQPNATLMAKGGDWQDNGPCTAFYVKK